MAAGFLRGWGAYAGVPASGVGRSGFGVLRMRLKNRIVSCVALVLAAGSAVFAQPTVPVMPTIPLPVDGASIVTQVMLIGVTILLLIAGPVVGFKLVKNLIKRLSQTVS